MKNISGKQLNLKVINNIISVYQKLIKMKKFFQLLSCQKMIFFKGAYYISTNNGINR